MSTSAYRPFRSVLVANRGEIAVRVLRAARLAGLEAVAIASEPDRTALHALEADRCEVIGAGPVAESYLDAGKVLAAAARTGADALHPGYGFFAENADFARQVLDAGLVWIGPPPDVITRLGDKVEAKALARAAGVPVLPGYEGALDDPETALAEAERIGYPLLVKAAAGGGGRGMRVVRDAASLPGALESAAREALGAFGSDRVFLERFVDPARHVEIQILADAHGHVVHLGERECSVQRRHQKIVEESPSPVVDPALRQRMGDAAVALTKAVGYVGAGTVEFLLGPDGEFYFLEVNTRLQVEHPVTELVTGLDLVDLQFSVAAGEPLPITQEDVRPRGHAIEVRVCAEDPAQRFAPQTGRIWHLELPGGPGIRVDEGVRAGYEIPPHYDSLVLKLIAFGPDRARALARLLGGLRKLVILGPGTNVEYLAAIVGHEAFASGDLSTGFLDDHLADWTSRSDVPDAVLAAAVASEMLARVGTNGGAGGAGVAEPDPWQELGPWRTVGQPGEGAP